ncbi:hypothetical protein JCM10908_004169 [Rhodotorula pacifica]|uniref:uncharacterized protein n=1 Tax=Rhodotorula pacifica TaxID=1495444 RepID=UPI00317B9477
MAAAAPGSPLGDSSFNLQQGNSPRMHVATPEQTHTPKGDSVWSMTTPGRLGESPLAQKDLNSPGSGLLLIDVEPSESRDCTPKSLQVRTPSAFARSLLDRTPGMFKAQLGSPLIPLGTPVTTRKRAQRAPFSAVTEKENGTPSVRRSARLASPCPGPPPAESPASAKASSPASSASTGLRCSPTPRKSRTTPRKAATPAKTAVPVPVSITLNGSSTGVSPSQSETKSAASPKATPARVSFAASSLLHSPFPAFSPSTPLIRTHDSYSDTELTDCDADGSIWEDDYEDPSFTYLAGSAEPEVVAAFERLQVDESEEAVEEDDAPGATDSSTLDASAHAAGVDDSVLLTATEVESSSSGSEAEDEPSIELDTIAEDDEAALDGSSSTSTSDVACPEESSVVEEATATDGVDLPESAVDHSTDSDMEDSEAESAQVQQEGNACEILQPVDDPSKELAEISIQSAPTSEESALPTPESFDEPEVSSAVDGAEFAPADDANLISSPLTTAPLPSDDGLEAVELDVTHPPLDSVEEDDDAPSADEAAQTTVADNVAPTDSSAPTVEEVSTQRTSEPVKADPERQAELDTPEAYGDGCPEPSLSIRANANGEVDTTPARIRTEPETTTPTATPQAATPLRRPLAATVPAAQQPLGKAAPTARRQLTKLTSIGAQRSTAPAKSTLTTLVPSSSAVPRRLPVSSRLAVPKRGENGGSEPLHASASTLTAPSASLSARTASQPSSRPIAGSAASEPARLAAGLRRGANLSASTSPNFSVEQARPVRSSSAQPARTASLAGKSADARREAPAFSRLDRAGLSGRAPLTMSTTASRAQTVPRRPFGGGPTATSAVSTFTASRPRVAVTRPAAPTTSTKASLTKTSSLAVDGPADPMPGRTPRAALAVRQTASAPSLVAPDVSASSTVPSPAKPKAAQSSSLADAALPAALAPMTLSARPRSPALPSSTAVFDSVSAGSTIAEPLAPLAPSVLSQSISRSPLPPSRLVSPPRPASSQAHASPLRSPRRVPISQQMQPGIVAPTTSASILVAPAQTVAAAAPAVFGGSTRNAAPPRMTRTTRRTAPSDAPAPVGHAAAPMATRPVRATALGATSAGSVAPGPPPGGRMARKITRRQAPIEADETAAAESAPATTAAEVESSASSDTSEQIEKPPSATPRPLPTFRPAPVLTQVELNRLTQRNTKKNQQTFNQLKLETVFLDYDRPPSPTSKIRKSSSLANAASKEGREARAAKRRNALRASVDGSELEALSLELSAEDLDTETKEHYRAPGDEEPYSTPARTATSLKGVAKGKAAGSKKRTSTEAALDQDDEGKPVRRVRWDRSLVYDGPREGYAKPPDASIIVIKTTELDAWGNPTAPARDLGKAVPVTIRMRVFKNDEK